MTIDNFLARFDRSTATGGQHLVKCPAHDDRQASLAVRAAEDGRILLRCHAGCATEAIVAALGLELRDLFPSNGNRHESPSRMVATYDYKDEQGALLSQAVRFEPKAFRQRRPDGSGGWSWNLNGTRRVLYRLPELRGREAVLVVEGEKDANAAWALGLPATCNAGGAGKWTDDHTSQLVAAGVKRIAVIADHDEPGRAHAEAVARSAHAAGLQVRLIAALPGVGLKGDLSDFLATHTKDEFMALLKSLKDQPTYAPPTEAQAPPQPDASPKSRQKKPAKDKAGRELRLDDPDPWPEPVAGDVLLEDLSALLRTFVVFAEPAYADALALWIVHSYAMDAWWISPLAVANSPTMRCGKTTLLQLVAHLASRSLPASNISPAALFRAIEKYRPTLILDEAETFLKDNEELRGLVNAGHTRKTAVVIRTVGEQHEAAAFSTWCAKFLALIGRLPPTLMDRALVIPMRRKMAGERVERLRVDQLEARCLPLRRQMVRWVQDMGDGLRTADPRVPAELDDRAADNWRPLLALADAAGGVWPKRAREAAGVLSGTGERDEPSLSVQLLADLRELLDDEDTPAMASSELVRRLVALEDRPWATCSKNDRPLTPNGLARLLKPFGIVPAGTLRVGEKTMKGYRRCVFEDAWHRYLPSSPPVEPSQRNNSNKTGPELAISQPSHEKCVTDRKSEISSITTGLGYGVTDENPREGVDGQLGEEDHGHKGEDEPWLDM